MLNFTAAQPDGNPWSGVLFYASELAAFLRLKCQLPGRFLAGAEVLMEPPARGDEDSALLPIDFKPLKAFGLNSRLKRPHQGIALPAQAEQMSPRSVVMGVHVSPADEFRDMGTHEVVG